MPIVSTDIKYRLSGGSSNSSVDASLGGVESSVAIVDATVGNLFDSVSGAESAAGSTKYRCFYAHNGHATLTLQGATIWIDTGSPDSDVAITIGLDPAAVNSAGGTIGVETTAPTGVTFTAPSSGSPLTIGDIPAGEYKAVWVKRVVNSGAAAYNADSVILKVSGDTAA
jgi:hypothetical protein